MKGDIHTKAWTYEIICFNISSILLINSSYIVQIKPHFENSLLVMNFI